MDELLTFAEEAPPAAAPRHKPWKILVVDDEDSIHDMTRRVLADITYDGRALAFLDAYSGTEARVVLSEHPDIAIILLDVVMETDDAGLRLARYIREELRNRFVRIILRTGQPGTVPERQVISAYDINDYKEKTELTATKMYTTTISSLRDFQLLQMVDHNRKGLDRILDSVHQLGHVHAFREFTEGLVTQVVSLLRMDDDCLYLAVEGFAAAAIGDRFTVLAGTGEFAAADFREGRRALPGPVAELLERALQERRSLFDGDAFVGYMGSEDSDQVRLLYLNGCSSLAEADRDLLIRFVTNVSVSADNLGRDQRLCLGNRRLLGMLEHLLARHAADSAVGRVAAVLAARAGLPPETRDRVSRTALFADLPAAPETVAADQCLMKLAADWPNALAALRLAHGEDPLPGVQTALAAGAGEIRLVRAAAGVEGALRTGGNPVHAAAEAGGPELAALVAAALPELDAARAAEGAAHGPR